MAVTAQTTHTQSHPINSHRGPIYLTVFLAAFCCLIAVAPTIAQTDPQSQQSAASLFHEGQLMEKSGQFTKAVTFYKQALSALSRQKHDLKFHLKIETALSRVKAKAGLNQ